MHNITVLQAQALLGRTLTNAEQGWLYATAGVHEYYLFCSTIVLLTVFYPLACAPYIILEQLRLPFFEQYRLQPSSYNAPEDIWKSLKSVMRTILTTILPLQLLSYPAFKMVGLTAGLPLPPARDVALQLLVFFLVEDYLNYWIHRFLHTKWYYDRIHYMHHEFETPCSSAASYAHWAEILLLGSASFAGPAIVRCHVVTLWSWIVLRQWEAIETHSGYHFPWSPTRLIPFYGGAEFHDHHHLVGGQSTGNFASCFTYCDTIYGTDKGYRVRKQLLGTRKKAA